MQYKAELSRHVVWTASWVGLALCAACGGSDAGDRVPAPQGFSGNGGLPSSIGGGASNPAAARGGGSSGRGAEVPSSTCATALADTAPVTPTIWLVVDGSSSMDNRFGGGQTRWQALRSTLMDPGGVVDSLQAAAEFGLVIYAGQESADLAQCVQLVVVPPALNNYAALAAMYPADPLANGTPTDKALDHVVTSLPVTNQALPDGNANPVYVVLATDGQPNEGCGDLGGGGGGAVVEQRVIDVTQRGTDAGMQMYVISLAGEDDNLQAHLSQVAMATSSRTPPFVPATQSELVDNFQRIIGGASCQIDLDGIVQDGQECAGRVLLNGAELTCDADDGWRLLDADTLQLTGTACSTFLTSQSSVSAMFPCQVFRPD
jgi:hypothetical protein